MMMEENEVRDDSPMVVGQPTEQVGEEKENAMREEPIQKKKQIVVKLSGMRFPVTTLLLLAIAVVAVVIAVSTMFRSKEEPFVLSPAMLKEIKEVVKISTLEIQDELCIKDTIKNKHIVARQVLNGYINFDIEKELKHEMRNDTLIIYLPPEEIVVLESGDVEKPYEPLDEWSDDIFFSRGLTTAEENTVKRRWCEVFKCTMYERGHVRQARKTAVETLTQLFSITSKFGRTVIVVDETPEGFYKQQYLPDAKSPALNNKRR